MTYAWRCWTLHDDGVLASALAPAGLRGTRFAPGQGWTAAECAFHEHPAPDQGCRCGLRGEPDLAVLLWWLADFKQVWPGAVGRVELGGVILAGDPAHPEIPGILRAGRARVAGPVFVPAGLPEGSCAGLGARYGVQVVTSAESRWNRFWVKTVPALLARLAA